MWRGVVLGMVLLCSGCSRDWEAIEVDTGATRDGLSCGIPADQQTTIGGRVWSARNEDPVTHSEAQAHCSARGARLPTPTEWEYALDSDGLSAVDEVGGVYWTDVVSGDEVLALDREQQRIVGHAPDASFSFRCLCAGERPTRFEGTACHGDGDEACVPSDGGYVLDQRERVAMTKAHAVAECRYVGARIADVQSLSIALELGEVVKPSRALWVAEDAGDRSVTLHDEEALRASSTGVDNNRPFFCRGVSEQAVVPARDNDHENVTALAMDDVSREQASWTDAVATCAASGGHLPTITELEELFSSRLDTPEGLWTATATPSSATTAVTTETGHFGRGEALRTAERRYRCIYYPINPDYEVPCVDCIEVALGDDGARMWLSEFRPSETLWHAYDTCRDLGGSLASERDLLEALRLTGISGSDILTRTSSFVRGDTTLATIGIRYRDATEVLDGTHLSALPTDQGESVRCTFTNELR